MVSTTSFHMRWHAWRVRMVAWAIIAGIAQPARGRHHQRAGMGSGAGRRRTYTNRAWLTAGLLTLCAALAATAPAQAQTPVDRKWVIPPTNSCLLPNKTEPSFKLSLRLPEGVGSAVHAQDEFRGLTGDRDRILSPYLALTPAERYYPIALHYGLHESPEFAFRRQFDLFLRGFGPPNSYSRDPGFSYYDGLPVKGPLPPLRVGPAMSLAAHPELKQSVVGMNLPVRGVVGERFAHIETVDQVREFWRSNQAQMRGYIDTFDPLLRPQVEAQCQKFLRGETPPNGAIPGAHAEVQATNVACQKLRRRGIVPKLSDFTHSTIHTPTEKHPQITNFKNCGVCAEILKGTSGVNVDDRKGVPYRLTPGMAVANTLQGTQLQQAGIVDFVGRELQRRFMSDAEKQRHLKMLERYAQERIAGEEQYGPQTSTEYGWSCSALGTLGFLLFEGRLPRNYDPGDGRE